MGSETRTKAEEKQDQHRQSLSENVRGGGGTYAAKDTSATARAWTNNVRIKDRCEVV